LPSSRAAHGPDQTSSWGIILTQAKSESTVETVANGLRRGIREGRFTPGQRLIEAELRIEFNVSRGPLREALRRLAAEGLVEMELHRGARVRRFTRADAMALYDIREALEGLAARLAARRVGEGTIKPKKLLDLTDAMSSALNAGRIAKYIELNQSFHDVLLEWAGNAHLTSLVQQLQVPVFRLQFRVLADLRTLKLGNKDHAAIAKAVAAADEDRAEDAMRAHIRRSGNDTRALPDNQFNE
jgi:DNA-binding GntR family transcriptional regulator